MTRTQRWLPETVLMALAVVTGSQLAARAQIIVSSNDNHSAIADGVVGPAKSIAADTVSVIDVSKFPPKVVATIDAPGSVMGPPLAVAVSHDESFALITSSSKFDSASGKVIPADVVSLLDLKSSPPHVVQTIAAGTGASSVSVSPDQKVALVSNRGEGTVSVFSIKDGKLESIGKVDLGNPKSGPSGIAFLPDGKAALLTRDADHMVNVLHIEGTKVTLDPRPITTGVKPYTVDVSPSGSLAAVSNMGRQDGDMDTISLIDLNSSPVRNVNTISVASCPEGLKFSPDGKFLAVGAQDGTIKASSSPFYKEHGQLIVYSVNGSNLKKVAQAPIGKWSQGIAFSKDGKTILVQNMVEKNISVFRFNGGKLTAAEPLAINAGPAALGGAWP